NFNVKNNNSFPIYGAFEYNLSLNNQDFLSGQSSAIKVGANSQESFSINSRIDLPKAFGMLSDMLKELDKGQNSIPFQIDGVFKTSAAGFPVEVPLTAKGELPLPKLPEVKVESLAVKDISLTSATLEIKTNLKNKNDFPINIDSFIYQLTAGNHDLAAGDITDPIQIEANGEQTSVLRVKVNFANLNQDLINQIKNNTLEADLQKTFNSIK
ncbi:MAG: LEA type 2 family protein, partial [Candidatus Margulisbacteria bacterium]|nr:LEA type 2 family protein [Candidatus Margulisiibacteriota bacterium]